MSQESVKVSFKPSKLAGFFLLAIVAVAIIFLVKNNSKKTTVKNTDTKEIILPQEAGVADSGFELNNATNITTLNAKTTFDALEEIDGKQSLKIYFFENAKNSNASIKIRDYINDIEANSFYRLIFLARTNADKEKNIRVSVSGENGSQNLGNFSLVKNAVAHYYEFNFQAKDNVSDLIFSSTDGKKADVWIDSVLMEKINIESSGQLEDIKPTIFGGTSRFNVDQIQTEENGDSENFFAVANQKMGQIFQPTQPLISGVALKIQKKGTGGAGTYHLQIRKYDEEIGSISDEVIATRKIYTDYP
ncbi:MAG: hypothetical protein C0412_05580, partial [Flavobacterium sp.]|nr:hypothetical protein [Flavobacterium sp.]